MVEFLVLEDICSQDLKRGIAEGTSTLARGLIRVIHTTTKQVNIMKTPPRVLVVSSISDMELEKPIHKKSC